MSNEIKDIPTTKTSADIQNTDWFEGQTAAGGALSSFKIAKSELLASTPDASETVKGIIEIATQAETNTGTDDVRALTPLKLASEKGATGGIVGMSGFSIAFKNLANTFTSLLQNAATAIRTYVFPDRSGTVTLDPERNDVTLANGVVTIDWAAGDIQNLTISEAKVITTILNPALGKTLILIIPGTNSLTFSTISAVIDGTYASGVQNRIYIQCLKVSGGAEYRITYDNPLNPYPFATLTSSSNVSTWTIANQEWFSKRTLTLTENSTFALSGQLNGFQGECWVTASGAIRTISVPAGATHKMMGIGDTTTKIITIPSGGTYIIWWSYNGTDTRWGYIEE